MGNLICSQGEQVATLEEVEGVVSVRSFEALIQWIYLRGIQFDSEGLEDQIPATIELVRLADICNITGMESQMARYIKDVLVTNPDPQSRIESAQRKTIFEDPIGGMSLSTLVRIYSTV